MAYTRKRGKKSGTRKRRVTKAKAKYVTTKKEVKTIAKAAVLKMAENKYFNTNSTINAEQVNAAWRVSTLNSDIGVWGYSTGYNRQSNPGNENEAIRYGVSTADGSDITITNLKMNQVFLRDDTNETLRAFVIEGQHIRPGYNECKWFLNHLSVNTSADETKGLNYRVRCIRVRPKAIKGSYQDIDPQNDLFLDQYNQPFGIASLNAAGTDALFTREQFHLAKSNSRRYSVLQDSFYTIAPANTYNPIPLNDGAGSTVLSVGTISSGCATMTTKHNIGKQLFYPKAETGTETLDAYPDTGFVPEYIFWHVIALGDGEVTQANRGTPLGMTISARPVSCFKDI